MRSDHQDSTRNIEESCFFIGIAGGSGSGKTTFANKLLSRVQADLTLVQLDAYYLSPVPSDLQVNGKPNFDHPLAFDWDLLNLHLNLLRAGKSIEAPIYDCKKHCRLMQVDRLGPSKIVIIEGIYGLWKREVRDLLDIKLFLRVDADIRLIRRFSRDIRERGRTLESVIEQYYETVRPMYKEFVSATKDYADLIIGEESDSAADIVVAKIRELI